MERQIVTTADGSKTIFLPEWNEHYHSSHGALQEAQHVFIRHGLHLLTSDYITVLEMGFGTGLNALLTFFSSEKRNQYVHYIGIEAFPPSEEEIAAMDYASFASDPTSGAIYEHMHATSWNTPAPISEHFVLEKQLCDLQNATVAPETVDLVYFDAFGPRVQPELWTPEVFQRIYDWLVPGGILVTYCAKGQVKRDLKSVGFLVESLPGPPGKREMTRAFKR
ncbi:MAG: tRNA (5-methylaminomethyl-2-thiouridine)(34)-methyltransferase MnmD [Fluviicola sp.]|nr:tRNA (5-methylaminomethyl-2-thiouridine)(34)-methyltransferase MnmD [Fluviicola sp.]